MVSPTHVAKSAKDWGTHELSSYNITIQFQDTATFFGIDPLPYPSLVSSEMFTITNPHDATDNSNFRLLFQMDLAMTGITPLDHFATLLLSALGYDSSRTKHIVAKEVITLTICGKQCHAKPNVCILDSSMDNNILLLLKVNKHPEEQKDPKPQLIAEAIAAFQRANARQTQILGQDPINVKVIPGIILTGTLPTFFKIPITKELAQAVELGQFPATPTIVFAHLPVVPCPVYYGAMRPLDNRRLIFACFEQFKQFVD